MGEGAEERNRKCQHLVSHLALVNFESFPFQTDTVFALNGFEPLIVDF